MWTRPLLARRHSPTRSRVHGSARRVVQPSDVRIASDANARLGVIHDAPHRNLLERDRVGGNASQHANSQVLLQYQHMVAQHLLLLRSGIAVVKSSAATSLLVRLMCGASVESRPATSAAAYDAVRLNDFVDSPTREASSATIPGATRIALGLLTLAVSSVSLLKSSLDTPSTAIRSRPSFSVASRWASPSPPARFPSS